jgi:threonine/homoserine/homoserine lactone efflux protein
MMVDAILDHIPWWGWLIIIGVPTGAVFYFFSPIIIPLWTATPRWLKALLMFVGAVFVAFMGGRYRGRANAEQEERERNADALQKRQEVDNDIGKLSEDDVQKRLDRWRRD